MADEHGGLRDPDPERVDPESGDEGYPGDPEDQRNERGDGPDAGQGPDGEQRPAVLLDELVDQLQEADAAAQVAQKKFEALQADVNALTKANDDLDKAVEQYGQAKGNLDQQLRAQEAYDEEKGEVVENAVGDDKDEVDAAWDWVRRKLADLHEKRGQYWEALNAATDEHTKKQRPVVTAQTNFDELKGRQPDLLQRLKDIADLQKRIAAAEDESDAVKMYALLLEFRKRLSTVDEDLVVVKEYREELYKAWRELSEAQEAFRAAGEARTQAQQDYDETKAELTELEAGRVEAVLKRIPAPPADAAPAQ